jgi:hypothetical protein
MRNAQLENVPGSIQLITQANVLIFRTNPKGMRLSARGCRDAATVRRESKTDPTPAGLRLEVLATGPLRQMAKRSSEIGMDAQLDLSKPRWGWGIIGRVTQGSQLCGNLGLEGKIPLGFERQGATDQHG